jgi:hypothetical protein
MTLSLIKPRPYKWFLYLVFGGVYWLGPAATLFSMIFVIYDPNGEIEAELFCIGCR